MDYRPGNVDLIQHFNIFFLCLIKGYFWFAVLETISIDKKWIYFYGYWVPASRASYRFERCPEAIKLSLVVFSRYNRHTRAHMCPFFFSLHVCSFFFIMFLLSLQTGFLSSTCQADCFGFLMLYLQKVDKIF